MTPGQSALFKGKRVYVDAKLFERIPFNITPVLAKVLSKRCPCEQIRWLSLESLLGGACSAAAQSKGSCGLQLGCAVDVMLFKSPPATQRTESAWLQEPKHGRKKTIITTIPDLQYACTSIRRADGPGFQPLSARRHPTEITLCVDYVVNPTPAMIPIGASFHKTLTPMVKDREVAFTNTLPWRKSAEELKNEPKFVTWK